MMCVVCVSMCVPCGGLEQMCLFVLIMLFLWLKLVLFVVVVIVWTMVKFMEILDGLAESKVMVVLLFCCHGCDDGCCVCCC